MRWQWTLTFLLLSAVTAVAQPVAVPKVICAQNRTPKDDRSWLAVLGLTDTADVMNCGADIVPPVRIGDTIAVHVTGYSKPPDKDLHLFVEGFELQNLALNPSEAIGTDPATKEDVVWTELKFDENTKGREPWVQMLRAARANGFGNRLRVSIGPAGGPQWPTTARITLNLYPKGYFIAGMTLIGGLLVVLILLGVKTNVLRDHTGAAVPPFSLAKHQMAVWFVVVATAYLFVSMTTGAAAATSSTALILIGISGATGLAAVVIDQSKRNALAADRPALEAERATLTQLLDDPTTGLRVQLANAAPGSLEATQLAAVISSKEQRLEEIAAVLTPRPSQRWDLDLLSDENGISFHRLQIAVWTIVLVLTFIRAVWRDFAMPDFDTTTLGLMGVSSGTYIGFKFPEKQP